MIDTHSKEMDFETFKLAIQKVAIEINNAKI